MRVFMCLGEMCKTYGRNVLHVLGLVRPQRVGSCKVDEIQVILYQVTLEGFQGQLAVPHAHDKGMFEKLAPDGSDVWPVE
jgi:hypothetical protein